MTLGDQGALRLFRPEGAELRARFAGQPDIDSAAYLDESGRRVVALRDVDGSGTSSDVQMPLLIATLPDPADATAPVSWREVPGTTENGVQLLLGWRDESTSSATGRERRPTAASCPSTSRPGRWSPAALRHEHRTSPPTRSPGRSSTRPPPGPAGPDGWSTAGSARSCWPAEQPRLVEAPCSAADERGFEEFVARPAAGAAAHGVPPDRQPRRRRGPRAGRSAQVRAEVAEDRRPARAVRPAGAGPREHQPVAGAGGGASSHVAAVPERIAAAAGVDGRLALRQALRVAGAAAAGGDRAALLRGPDRAADRGPARHRGRHREVAGPGRAGAAARAWSPASRSTRTSASTLQLDRLADPAGQGVLVRAVQLDDDLHVALEARRERERLRVVGQEPLRASKSLRTTTEVSSSQRTTSRSSTTRPAASPCPSLHALVAPGGRSTSSRSTRLTLAS